MKRLVGFAALVVSAYVARRVVNMRDAMAAVAPELRSPILPLLPDSYTSLTFPLTRLGMRLSTKPGTGVTVTERYVDSEPAVRVLVTTPSAAGEPAACGADDPRRRDGPSAPRNSKPSGPAVWRGSSTPSSSHPTTDWRPSIHSPPRSMTAWRPCGGCVRAQMNWASTPTASRWQDPAPAVVSARRWRNAAQTRASGCGRRCWSTRCSTTAPPFARSRRPWPVHIDTGIQSVGVDRVSGPRAADVRRARVRSACATHRSVRPPAGLGGRRRPRHPLRRRRRLRRTARGVRSPVRVGRCARDVSRGRRH